MTGTFGNFFGDPAYWKRYRGGTAGRLWTGPASILAAGADSAAAGQFRRVLADLPGHLDSPMIVAGRLVFLSDHEGTGNLYSCAPDGSDLRRHTDHDGSYARQASTDGERIVYQCAGEIWLLPGLAAQARPLDIDVDAIAAGRTPRPLTAADHVGSLSVDRSGTASAVEVRGTVHWLTHRDGPAGALFVQPGVRARLPQVLGDDGSVVWVSDSDGADGLDITAGPDAACPDRRLASGQLGWIRELAASPDGATVAVAAADGRLFAVTVADGAVRELAASGNGPVTGLSWSPDSAWLAWSEPTSHPGGMGEQALRSLRLARPADGQVADVTDGRFIDTNPVFTLDGKYLAFLSKRSFDPVYDAHFFDLSFPFGARPYLVPLARTTPSPFGPQPGGRPMAGQSDDQAAGGGSGGGGSGGGGSADAGAPRTLVDADGLAGRVVQVPVPESRYSGLRAVKGGLAWLREPLTGNLGLGAAQLSDDQPRPVLERFDFNRRQAAELRGSADWCEVSKDGTRLVVSDEGALTVIPADRRADSDNPDDEVRVDRSRARFTADPVALWQHALTEAGRIIQHEFWIDDLADVDFDAAIAQYRPLLDRVSTASEFADVLWETVGELGTSHAYVQPPGEQSSDAGLLGADLTQSGGGWLISAIVTGDSSDPRARSPLTAPGAAIAAGDELIAVDGQPVGPAGPGPLLTGTAGKPVTLTVAAGGGERRRSVVVPLRDDRRLRYLDWVSRNRAMVRQLSDGRVGYLHVPDMVSQGWADFHRDLRSEMLRDALVIDVRGNSGGHTSQLVVEKLARRVIAWDNPRGGVPSTYPEDAPRGPVVAVADELAGSDGDIVTAAIRILGLGPVIGARTWGGVIGYDAAHELVDGTQITVPKLAFWMDGSGWGVENHGVDPDIEVIPAPGDWAPGRDVQLEAAVRQALAALADRPAVRPPDPRTRPSRRRPPLPPRAAG